jgi:hypothetical protein
MPECIQSAPYPITAVLKMASIQRITSPIAGRVSYRAQVRLKGHPGQSETFRNHRDAERWAASLESAILERRHFPHTRAQHRQLESGAQARNAS